jgi:hemerythrin
MALFEWKDNYSVGIKKIDEQHKILVGYINDLYESMRAGKGKETLGTVLKELIDYTKTHFKAEESLLKVYKYPDLDGHQKKHKKMAEHVQHLNRKFISGEISNPIQITNFLKDWLAKHILETDKVYGRFLNDKGVR